MKVTIHTSRVYEEDWDIPGLPAGTPDADIITIVQGGRGGVPARRRGHRMFDVGAPFVYSRGVTDVEAEGRKLAEKRQRTEREVRDFARRACEAGASERLVASTLGVDRNTVRAWLGKRR